MRLWQSAAEQAGAVDGVICVGGAARLRDASCVSSRNIENFWTVRAFYKIRALQGQPPQGRAARSHPRLQGTSILMGQPWPWAAAISTPSAQVPIWSLYLHVLI